MHIFVNMFLITPLCQEVSEIPKKNLEKLEYTPVGVCFEPSYRGALGPALVFQDKNGNTGWVHLGQSIMIEWLTELNMMPPDDIVWDWKVIKEHVWGEKMYE